MITVRSYSETGQGNGEVISVASIGSSVTDKISWDGGSSARVVIARIPSGWFPKHGLITVEAVIESIGATSQGAFLMEFLLSNDEFIDGIYMSSGEYPVPDARTAFPFKAYLHVDEISGIYAWGKMGGLVQTSAMVDIGETEENRVLAQNLATSRYHDNKTDTGVRWKTASSYELILQFTSSQPTKTSLYMPYSIVTRRG